MTPRPLRSTVVTRFIATMGLSDSHPQHPAWLLIPKPSLPLRKAPAAAAGLPSSRRFCPRALSPFTRRNPGRAFDRATVRVLASPPLAGWPFQTKRKEAESSLLIATARAFAFPGFKRRDCSHNSGVPPSVESVPPEKSASPQRGPSHPHYRGKFQLSSSKTQPAL